MTHGGFALETEIGYLAVVEHRLILARVRSEWSRLKANCLASIWCRGCQYVALPTCATAQFWRFFLIAAVLSGVCFPLVVVGFMNLVVLCGFQGADAGAGDFNVEPTKIP